MSAAKNDIRICFIGDSFVNGTGDETGLGWVGRVCAAAQTKHNMELTFYNLGVRRQTSQDIRLRWQAECEQRLPSSCDGRVLLSCGVNDTTIENDRARVALADSINHVRSILEAAGAYRTLQIGPPPVADSEQNQRIRALSQAYAQQAHALNVPYIDLFTPLVNDARYQREVAENDHFHPRSQGYSRMAGVILASPLWWFSGTTHT
jgi:acyl-CoA thioesterase I